MGKQIATVLSLLQEGPATSIELADESGLSVKHCSAYLRELLALGILTRTGPHRSMAKAKAGRAPFLYALKG